MFIIKKKKKKKPYIANKVGFYKIYNNCINEITVEKQNEKSLAVHLKTPAAHRLRNTSLDSLEYYYQNYY
jgi:hypothetical protein